MSRNASARPTHQIPGASSDGKPAIQGDPLLVPMHDSYKPPFLTLHPSIRVIPHSATLQVSVQERLAKCPEYRPSNLPQSDPKICIVVSA